MGAAPTKENLSRTCKHLHLAFKGYESAEVYNILAACLLKVASKWDPFMWKASLASMGAAVSGGVAIFFETLWPGLGWPGWLPRQTRQSRLRLLARVLPA